MPEGDAVYKDARALRERVVGVSLVVRCRWPRVVEGLSRIEHIETRGKHLLLHFDRAVLRVHRRMKGTWRHFQSHRFPRQDLALALLHDQGASVCYLAPEVERIDPRSLAAHPVLAALGPDVLAEDFDPAEAVARTPAELSAGEALLKQQIACGIGNVYRAETLFWERVSPFTPVGEVERPERLWARAQALMVPNLAPRRNMETRRDGPPDHWVYGRARRRCLRCGQNVQARDWGTPARTVYWCGRCQRA